MTNPIITKRRSETGCPRLDAFHVSSGNSGVGLYQDTLVILSEVIVKICCNCPEKECILERNVKYKTGRVNYG